MKPTEEIKKDLKKEKPKPPVQFIFIPKKAIEAEAKRLKIRKS